MEGQGCAGRTRNNFVVSLQEVCMNTRFTPAKLSAAIVTLSLMSAPLYTVADEHTEAAENLNEIQQSAEDRPAIEEKSYDTQQVAQELNETQEEAEQETEQAAAEIEQETEQAAAEVEQETEEATAELEQETEQAAAEFEEETEEAAAETEQETEQAAAELDNEEGIVEGETVAENEELTADEEIAAASAEEDEELSGPMEDVQESAAVIQQMQADADMKQVLDQAKAILVVPDYAVGALIVGASGGEGVLLKKQDSGEWSNPVFYDIGGISAGLQAGAAAGSIAMILMSDNALDTFREDTNFGFTADAGFSIINWSERARAEIGMGTDAVVWTDTEGLFGELAVGVTGVSPDEEEIAEYYNKEAEPNEILAGNVENPHEQMLQQALKEQ
ncbi:lipid-binding SYLF domain-containing protein [Proteobacteria bacterium 005FR1]|nr:lipid-binding SYLF domain-containing protein [Proteobacteria bacterium 005FR1]